MTPLHTATKQGHMETVGYLIDQGARIEINGVSMLVYKVYYWGYINLASSRCPKKGVAFSLYSFLKSLNQTIAIWKKKRLSTLKLLVLVIDPIVARSQEDG